VRQTVDDRPTGNIVVRAKTTLGTVWGGSGGTGPSPPQAALVARFFQEHLKRVWYRFRGATGYGLQCSKTVKALGLPCQFFALVVKKRYTKRSGQKQALALPGGTK
jgi:hypothetical protein